jgi:hypothetical protein
MVAQSLEQVLKLTTVTFESKKHSIFDPSMKITLTGKCTFTDLIKVPANISKYACHTQNTLWDN